jgi:hypothetical protein
MLERVLPRPKGKVVAPSQRDRLTCELQEHAAVPLVDSLGDQLPVPLDPI